jgi:hypothetical protein
MATASGALESLERNPRATPKQRDDERCAGPNHAALAGLAG